MTVTVHLVEYALNAFAGKTPIPSNVFEMGVQAIIDQYGLQVGGSEFPWSHAIYNYLHQYEQSTGKSTITRFGDKVSAAQAAFINGSFAHAQDFDDSHQEAQTHPGSVVIPAAIAIGEMLNLSGELVLKAIVIGMEIMLRLAYSLCPACIEGGHHTPPTVGPFGAAIAAGLLLGLSKEKLIYALGICGSYAGGLVEYTLSGGSVKRIHTGLGARAGVEAALLAKEGITGPVSIIDGKKGMWAVFGRGNAFEARLLDGIGEKYMLLTLMFKPYNCCYLIHPAIQLFLEMCTQHKLSPQDIKAVKVGYSKFSVSHAGKIILPHDALGAQFSTSFTLALSLIVGVPGMLSYSDEVLKNPQILALAKKIEAIEDGSINAEFPKKNGCTIQITTTDGEVYSGKIREPKGCPENQLTPNEIKEKFMTNTFPVISEVAAHALYEALAKFRSMGDVNELRVFSAPDHQMRARL